MFEVIIEILRAGYAGRGYDCEEAGGDY